MEPATSLPAVSLTYSIGYRVTVDGLAACLTRDFRLAHARVRASTRALTCVRFVRLSHSRPGAPTLKPPPASCLPYPAARSPTLVPSYLAPDPFRDHLDPVLAPIPLPSRSSIVRRPGSASPLASSRMSQVSQVSECLPLVRAQAHDAHVTASLPRLVARTNQDQSSGT